MIAQQYDGETPKGEQLVAFYLERAGVGVGLVSEPGRLPHLVHWGVPLAHGEETIALYDAQRPQGVGGELDEPLWPSVLPTQAEGWIGRSRCALARGGVEVPCRFSVDGVRLDVDQASLTIAAGDGDQGVGLTWTLQILESGLLRQRAVIRNDIDETLSVAGIQLSFPVPYAADELLCLSGRHLKERVPQRRRLADGRFEKISDAGRPDFDATLLLALGHPGFGFETGRVYAASLAWSGNGLLAAEKTTYTAPELCGGEVLHSGEVVLKRGEKYETPWLYGACGDGLNDVASRFHRHLRAVHPALSSRPRPVTLNTWEAIGFDHHPALMRELADKAAAVGVERFVVDDGWFEGRRHDRAGLGDWRPDRSVYPEGLHEVADYVHGLGMQFGLWFEPEMVNPDSQLYRSHPDWVLRPCSGRLPMPGRSQQVLDLTNPDAWHTIRADMDMLIDDLGIDYIKWDHNRTVTEAISPRSGRPAVHEQTLAVYRLIDALKSRHPGLEIEACASGGGRVDLGMLEHVDRVWVSDCVDPVERVDIQRHTSLLVPPEMMGEHVGAPKGFTTGRMTTDSMRMAMAFFGHMGVEWNLTEVPQESLSRLQAWIAMYRDLRKGFAAATVVHADLADPAVRLDGMVSADGSHAWYRFVQLSTSLNYPAALVRLPGLLTGATYRIRPLDIVRYMDDETSERGARFPSWWRDEGAVLSGAALMETGIRPPQIYPERAMVFEAIRLDGGGNG